MPFEFLLTPNESLYNSPQKDMVFQSHIWIYTILEGWKFWNVECRWYTGQSWQLYFHWRSCILLCENLLTPLWSLTFYEQMAREYKLKNCGPFPPLCAPKIGEHKSINTIEKALWKVINPSLDKLMEGNWECICNSYRRQIILWVLNIRVKVTYGGRRGYLKTQESASRIFPFSFFLPFIQLDGNDAWT